MKFGVILNMYSMTVITPNIYSGKLCRFVDLVNYIIVNEISLVLEFEENYWETFSLGLLTLYIKRLINQIKSK